MAFDCFKAATHNTSIKNITEAAHFSDKRRRLNQHQRVAVTIIWLPFTNTHQNPVKAGLVKRLEDWPYSSFIDYAGIRKGSLCNQLLAEERIGINKNNFIRQSYDEIDLELVQHIYDKRDWNILSQPVGTEGQTGCDGNET